MMHIPNHPPITVDLIYHQPKSMRDRSKWKLAHDTLIGDTLVPKGFVTDGASVPKLFLLFITPTSKAFPAAIVHDYKLSLLNKENYTAGRIAADDIFYDTLIKTDVDVVNANILYTAVSIFTIFKSIKMKLFDW